MRSIRVAVWMVGRAEVLSDSIQKFSMPVSFDKQRNQFQVEFFVIPERRISCSLPRLLSELMEKKM